MLHLRELCRCHPQAAALQAAGDPLAQPNGAGDPSALHIPAPDGVDVARLKCELHALQAAADGPVPLDLVCEGAVKPAGVRRREAALDDAIAATPDAAPELEAVDSSRFLAVVVALGYHEVRTTLAVTRGAACHSGFPVRLSTSGLSCTSSVEPTCCSC